MLALDGNPPSPRKDGRGRTGGGQGLNAVSDPKDTVLRSLPA